jgi:hypothetical protein
MNSFKTKITKALITIHVESRSKLSSRLQKARELYNDRDTLCGQNVKFLHVRPGGT